MKFYKKSRIKIVFVFVCFLISGFACKALGAAEPNQAVRIIPNEETPAILELIANAIRENYEQIKTWYGEIDKKITWVHTGSLAEELFRNATDAKGAVPKALLQKAEDKITFAVDANKNLVYVDTLRDKPSNYFNYNTGDNVGNSGPSPICSTIIARSDFILKAHSNSFEKGTGRLLHKRAIKEPLKSEPRTGWYKLADISDPRRAFFPGAGFTWDTLDNLIKRINKYGKIEFDGYKFTIEEHKKGDNIEYKIIEPAVVNMEQSRPEHYAIITMIFSSRDGFNMIYWDVATGSSMVFQEHTWEYELVDGIYLPKRRIIKIYDSNGTVTDEYDSTYNNNKVNQEVSPETFTYNNLGLKNGDKFIDKIEGKEYKYQDANLVFIADVNK
ncbi:MAG: hypothetical protein A2173_04730 [Planctomycetes bacterium RBG_13_44_8b]|nr:MAG: hypothetical protein A2173_04730 [Planctomycetes bacterium RBG_13_44_8b]